MSNPATNLERAERAWGISMPEWVRLLAGVCDRTSQREVADQLRRSGGTVSRIIRRDYAGSYREAELLVRARFAVDQVACPLHGQIPLASCLRARRHPGPALDQARRDFARICPTCPNNTDIKED